jgi:DNA-binding ferritin-like protein (Dps family)
MSDEEKSGIFAKLIGDKREWRAYKARVKTLPPSYSHAIDAIERYLNHAGGLNVDGAIALNNDLLELFERGAADGKPMREIVGDDPVEFIDELIRNYSKDGYLKRHRERLVDDINRAAAEEAGDKEASDD